MDQNEPLSTWHGLTRGEQMLLLGGGLMLLGLSCLAIYVIYRVVLLLGVAWHYRRVRARLLQYAREVEQARPHDLPVMRAVVLSDDEAREMRDRRVTEKEEARTELFASVQRLNAQTMVVWPTQPSATVFCDNPSCRRNTGGRAYCPHCGVLQVGRSGREMA